MHGVPGFIQNFYESTISIHHETTSFEVQTRRELAGKTAMSVTKLPQ